METLEVIYPIQCEACGLECDYSLTHAFRGRIQGKGYRSGELFTIVETSPSDGYVVEAPDGLICWLPWDEMKCFKELPSAD